MEMKWISSTSLSDGEREKNFDEKKTKKTFI
jgi:hypothetical protein